MSTQEAFDRIYHTVIGASSLLTMIADYGEWTGTDQTIVHSIEAVKDMLVLDEEFNVLDTEIEKISDANTEIVSLQMNK